MDFRIMSNESLRIFVGNGENSAVKIAASNLVRDLHSVVNADAQICAGLPKEVWQLKLHAARAAECKIIIRTGLNDDIVGADRLKDENGNFRKESFVISVADGRLFITGADRRGTIYGIYDFCESIGVSPWYWWADVPVKRRNEIVFSDGFLKTDYPTIEYRGIFINDEEELENWVQAHMGEDTIGVKTYEHIFELLLRLKANYIWPAMHVNSFNVKQENGALADRMGIVVGTSHCDILMRSNNREWYPWLEQMEYENVEYDYSIEGHNRDILNQYWDDSIKQNKDFEVCYTLGMRGIHDWGSSMRAVDEDTSLSPEQKKKAKVDMLSFIIEQQRGLLRANGVGDSMQIFIPYKEVLDLYDDGLVVPEDVTLVWANDNFGYMRRFPSEAEQARPGGNGVYYHVSYWAWPAMDYLFINSTPLAHIKNEMRKSYDNGIRKLWVLNVGAMKPLEQEMEFYIRYAWEIGKGGDTDDVITYLARWIERNFSIADGTEMAQILNDYAQLTNVRKVEHMSYDIFSQCAYGDEGARRINRYADLYERANRIYESLPKEEQDAFFQLVLMKIHAAYYINLDYYFADRSYLCHTQGKLSAANYYTELSRKADYYKRQMLDYYNKDVSGGKWDGMVTPELYKPPVTAMFPPRKPSLEKGCDRLGVVLWNDEDEVYLDRCSTNPKWIELYNPGDEEIEYEIIVPDGITVSESRGRFKYEKRIFINLAGKNHPVRGDSCPWTFIVKDVNNGSCITVPVRIMNYDLPEGFEGYVEADGYVSIPADGYNSNFGWRIIEHLGRGEGCALESPASAADDTEYAVDAVSVFAEENEYAVKPGMLTYSFWLRNSGEFTAEIFRFPTLNSVGRIRVAVSIDGAETITVESISNDEWRGTWKQNVMSNVDRLAFKLPYLSEGAHELEIIAIDRYFTFSGIVIYTDEKKPCYLAPRASYYAKSTERAGLDKQKLQLSNCGNCSENMQEQIPSFPDDYYHKELPPRDTVYAGTNYWFMQGLIDSNIRKPLAEYPVINYAIASQIVKESCGAIRIEAQSALAQDENAFIKGGEWEYADSETGLSMYIRKKGLRWNDLEQSPTLNYRIHVSDAGNYHVWLLMKLDVEPTSVAFGVDEKPQPLSEQYNGGELWCYEAKQIWRWTPVSDIALTEGEHVFSVYAVTSEMRIDRIYLTLGEELPPDALEWGS